MEKENIDNGQILLNCDKVCMSQDTIFHHHDLGNATDLGVRKKVLLHTLQNLEKHHDEST